MHCQYLHDSRLKVSNVFWHCTSMYVAFPQIGYVCRVSRYNGSTLHLSIKHQRSLNFWNFCQLCSCWKENVKMLFSASILVSDELPKSLAIRFCSDSDEEMRIWWTFGIKDTIWLIGDIRDWWKLWISNWFFLLFLQWIGFAATIILRRNTPTIKKLAACGVGCQKRKVPWRL